MNRELAEAIIAQYEPGPEDAWTALNNDHHPLNERVELARALAFVWRETADDPGFNHPPRALVERVGELIGEKVFTA